MATTFDKLFAEAVRKRVFDKSTQDAREWFRRAAAQTSTAPSKLMKDTSDQYGWTLTRTNMTDASIGRMYLFNYDPKLKKKLPYYDRYPLIFPFARESDSFLGLNLHYLPPRMRAALMDNLHTIANNDKYNSTTKLQLSYGLLKSASKFRFYKPCVKKYLNSHVRSQFMMVPAKHWDTCLFLPLARFEKASQATVWRDSQKIVNK